MRDEDRQIVDRSHRLLYSAREAGGVFAVYAMAIFWPMIFADGHGQDQSFILSTAVGVVLVGFFAWDGVAEWKRGRRAPLVVKVFVPLCLLVVSCGLWWSGWWAASLTSIRGS
jgi:hypothetical protein